MLQTRAPDEGHEEEKGVPLSEIWIKFHGLGLSQGTRVNMLARSQDKRRPWRRVVSAGGDGGCMFEPATTSLCPFRYFVAECITMSAP